MVGEQESGGRPQTVGHSVRLAQVGMVYRSRTGGKEAVRDVSLEVEPGEFISIVGPSGCGKSTLLKIIAGLIRPSAGQVLVNDQPVSGPRVDLGFVFQKPILLEWRSVLQNVMLQVEARKNLDAADYLGQAKDLLGKVGLAGFEHAYPHELSGGMSQRVSVCRALIHRPPLLLMDEPFGALDALTRDQLMVDLQKLWTGSRVTVVFVTHNVSEAIFLSDRIVIMSPRPGRVAQILHIELPRPRRLATRTSQAFGEYAERILGELTSMGVLHEDWGESEGMRDTELPAGVMKNAQSR